MIQDAGRSAHAVSSMQFVQHAPIVGPAGRRDRDHPHGRDRLRARRALARLPGGTAGCHDHQARPRDSPTPSRRSTKESSETYTVSYTAALVALALLAARARRRERSRREARAGPRLRSQRLADAGGRRRPRSRKGSSPFIGAGPASWTAREGALKSREAARFLAEGYDAEYFLHGSAVPLTPEDRDRPAHPRRRRPRDALGTAAEAEGIPVSRLDEPAPLPVLLAQIPLTVRLQLLALRFALERGQDPDKVIVGRWDDAALWSLAAPRRRLPTGAASRPRNGVRPDGGQRAEPDPGTHPRPSPARRRPSGTSASR